MASSLIPPENYLFLPRLINNCKMKKILFLLAILGFMAAGCKDCDDAKKTELPPIDWTKYESTDQDEVIAMAKHYNELIVKNPEIGFQQINMDAALLEELLNNTKGIKLIAAADLRTDAVTMFIQFWRSNVFSYYDINTIFNSNDPGMRGKPPLCPPPAGCDLPFLRSSNPEVMTEGKASEMALHYTELVRADPALAIQQITMDGLLLELLLYKTEGLKLIAAADLESNEITVIMQFWKEGDFSYYDIREIFTPDMRGMRGKPALCPPPAGCDIP